MEFLLKNWLAFVSSGAFVSLVVFLFAQLKKINSILSQLTSIPRMERTLVALKIEVESIDAATAKQYGNGYAQAKADKRKELIELYKLKEGE